MINCMDREDQCAVHVYREGTKIHAIALYASNKWHTMVSKDTINGAFTSKSEMFNPTKNLRTTPVMPHPPIISFLKLQIAAFEQNNNISDATLLRSPTPEPEAIKACDN